MYLVKESDLFDILRQLSPDQGQRLLNALTNALVKYSEESQPGFAESDKTLYQPLRSSIVTKHKNTALFMPSSDTTNNGVKVVTLPAKGLKGATGVINIFSPEGDLEALVAASEITAFRTALASLSNLVLYSHIPKHHIVLFGSGRQVEWHIRLSLLLIAPGQIEKFTIINRGEERIRKLQDSVLSQLQLSQPHISFDTIFKEDNPEYEELLRSALATSDVIFCCTPSTEPLFPNSYLNPQNGHSTKERFISLIGSYKPHMREIDTDTLLSGTGGKIYVDSKHACLEESGELRTAAVTEDQLIETGELYGSLNGTEVCRSGNVVFKCVGMGIMDLVIARTLVEVARESGYGVDVDW